MASKSKVDWAEIVMSLLVPKFVSVDYLDLLLFGLDQDSSEGSSNLGIIVTKQNWLARGHDLLFNLR